MPLAALNERLQQLGARPQHRERLLRHWLQALPLDHGRRPLQGFLPKALFEALPALFADWQAGLTLHTREPADDGSERLLWLLHDGQSVESVLLPPRAKSWGLCVSSQVGCAVGCGFCMTGQGGLVRQLSALEILAQVVAARQLRPSTRWCSWAWASRRTTSTRCWPPSSLLGTAGGFAHKQLVFSTVGDERVFARLLASPVKPALALSLHTTKPLLRRELLPRAPALEPAWLVEQADAYARASGYPLQIQWTLLEGVNDAEEDAILALLKGRFAILNLIPFNHVPGLPFRRPAWDAAEALAARLTRAGVLTKLRNSAGQDVEGGCGQLRARIQTERVVKVQRSKPSSVSPHERPVLGVAALNHLHRVRVGQHQGRAARAVARQTDEGARQRPLPRQRHAGGGQVGVGCRGGVAQRVE
jgi:23S rRNA (adenine2503-C2)-methyltransferase